MAELVRFEISHTTRYRFSKPVFLEPHTVRLQPRSCGYQSPEQFEVNISPAPAGHSRLLDAEGNVVTFLWFSGVHDQLVVRVRSRTRTRRPNPFDYVVLQEAQALPLSYDEPLNRLLEPALSRSQSPEGRDAVADFAAELSTRTKHCTLPFLALLTQSLYDRFEIVRRDDGAPWSPEETWKLGRGACRDLSLLFMDACRAVGLAARFVSGYQEGDPGQEQRDLHAWAEVYIPGAGWRGYDPTHGLAVADRHVAVAAAVRPQDAAPLSGSLRGTDATSTMVSEIEIRIEEDVRTQQQQQQ